MRSGGKRGRAGARDTFAMRVLLAVIVLVLGGSGGVAAASGPVRMASERETHAIAVDVRQPRWSCFEGRIAHGRPWAALRRLPGGGCPELPYAILVRADRETGWREVRRFWGRRAACAATSPRLPAALRRGLLDCRGERARARPTSADLYTPGV